VLHRVTELADRPAGYRPEGAPGFTNLVQLPQVVGEIVGSGPKSKRVTAQVGRLVAALGPELDILSLLPLDDISRAGGSLLAEAMARLRRGEVRREAGYDGEYGVVALFGPGELDPAGKLFDLPSRTEATRSAGRGRQQPGARPGLGAETASPPARAGTASGAGAGRLAGSLDADQRAAARRESPLMIIAGPGTGKTRALTRLGSFSAHAVV
jgi:DNA helicase-2/ATP-dependent DNA helicase PcrA